MQKSEMPSVIGMMAAQFAARDLNKMDDLSEPRTRMLALDIAASRAVTLYGMCVQKWTQDVEKATG